MKDASKHEYKRRYLKNSISGIVISEFEVRSEKQAGLTFVEYLGSRLMWKVRFVTKKSELQ